MSKLVATIYCKFKNINYRSHWKSYHRRTTSKEPIPNFTIEVPADRSHGDWATNAAMVSAQAFKQAPRKIAEAIASNISLSNTYFKPVKSQDLAF